MTNISLIVGCAGVGLLLAAFFMNLFRILRQDTIIYTFLNFFGAMLACMASLLIGYFPFVVLEAVWAAVALAGMFNIAFNRYKRKKKCI